MLTKQVFCPRARLIGPVVRLDYNGKQVILETGKTIFDFKGSLSNLGMSVDELREKGLSVGVDEET